MPNAEPKLEAIVPGGPNKPYVVEGQAYEPLASDVSFKQRGLASWYGAKFHGRRTASGEVYSMYGMTAAHRTLPIPSYARVRSVATGKSVIVRVNDRGPFHSSRVMDLSYTAAAKLDLLGRGTGEVEVERITFDQIRTGQWRTDQEMAEAGALAVGAAPAPSADPIYALASRLEGARPQAVAQPAAAVAEPLPPAQAVTTAAVSVPARAVATAPAALPAASTSPAAYPDAEPAKAAASAAPVAPVAPASLEVQAQVPSTPAVLPAARPAPESKAYAYTPAAKGYWVQLAAFSKKQGVDAFQQRVAQELSQLAPLLAVFNEASLYKLQVGPYQRRDEAQSVAQRIRDALQLVPMVVERR